LGIVTLVAGVPVITGGALPLMTEMLKLGSEVLDLPSLTLMMIPEYVAAYVGVPVNLPLYLLNVAHDGLLTIENVSGSLLASDAVGAKVKACFAVITVKGVPLMVGATLVAAMASVTVKVSMTLLSATKIKNRSIGFMDSPGIKWRGEIALISRERQVN